MSVAPDTERSADKAEPLNRRSYLVGFALALLLTLAAFGAVLLDIGGLGVLALLAAAQVIVHGRWFLHLDLSESKREDLQLVLFASLLITLMIGGTLWIMSDLDVRMM